MSSELQSGLVICKNFTHIWSKVRHKYIIKKQQQQQQQKTTHTNTQKKTNKPAVFSWKTHLSYVPMLLVSSLHFWVVITNVKALWKMKNFLNASQSWSLR